MSKNYCCDLCGKVTHPSVSIIDGDGVLRFKTQNISIALRIGTTSPVLQGEEVCYSCIAAEMLAQVQRRKEVIKSKEK